VGLISSQVKQKPEEIIRESKPLKYIGTITLEFFFF